MKKEKANVKMDDDCGGLKPFDPVKKPKKEQTTKKKDTKKVDTKKADTKNK